MSTEPKTIKFQLMLSEKEAATIDDWGFANRIRSRAEAMRRLCQIGLRSDADLEAAHTLTGLGFEWAVKAQEWALEDFRKHFPEHEKNAPLPVHLQAIHMAYMMALAARVHIAEMLDSGDALRSVKDLNAAIDQADKVSPELAEANEFLSKFLDDWKAKYPGASLQPPKD